MAQVRLQPQLVEQVGDPRPAKRAFHRHRRSRLKLRQLSPHGCPIHVLQPHPLHDPNLPELIALKYTQLAKPAMNVPAHCLLHVHSYLRRVWFSGR